MIRSKFELTDWPIQLIEADDVKKNLVIQKLLVVKEQPLEIGGIV